jgi:hypothetical protein
LIPTETTCFSCLDSKDAFFCIQLAPVSQAIFAFQWENPPPQWGGQQQLTWNCLQQGFKTSPTIFGIALTLDLWAYPAEKSWLHTLTSSLQQLTTKTVLKGQSFHSVSYKKLDKKYL